jgi:hypothetical protein
MVEGNGSGFVLVLRDPDTDQGGPKNILQIRIRNTEFYNPARILKQSMGAWN